MVIIIALLACVAAGIMFFRKSPPSFQAGGIYSIVNDGDGGFGIVKLLVYENGVCHVRIYKQKFQSRPQSVEPANLSLGKIGDPDGFGMGHLPIQESTFIKWQPVLMKQSPVTEEELEGYKIWKEAGGGAF
jgi:hypothetical protein